MYPKKTIALKKNHIVFFIKKTSVLLLLPVLLFSCTGSDKKEADAVADSLAVKEGKNPLEKNGIRLTEVLNSPEFPEAKIQILQPKSGDFIKPGKVKFGFKVENYQLGNQTPDATDKMCANSKQGQHIHFILNNGPYTALYKPEHEVELEEGHYVLLSFLSRSYHESIKSSNAYAITQFMVGTPQSVDTIITEDHETGELYHTEIAWFGEGKKKQQINMKLNANPYLFYSRPKGTYTGEDAKKIMLDFYLVNTTLSENGNKVKVNIDGTEFILVKWAPYFIEGLSMGEHKVSLTLIDKDNNPVFWASPFYESGERVITLQQDEPVAGK